VKAEKQAVAMEKLVVELGTEAFDMLSDDEKIILKLFIWAGCGCHKYQHCAGRVCYYNEMVE